MISEEIYGCDYSSYGEVTSSGDVKLVDGLENAKQAIRNQLLTRVGTYPSIDTEYGSRIKELWGEDVTTPNLDSLKVHINNSLLEQPRVKSVIDIKPYVSIDKKIKVNILVELVNEVEEQIIIEIGEQ